MAGSHDGETPAGQRVTAGRDAYVAGGDLHVHLAPPAASASTRSWIVGASPGLWLRSGPGFDYPTVDYLDCGQRAYGNCDGVKSGGTTWYLLHRNGNGWAWGNSAYLRPYEN